jgi:hypothetical protein
MSERFVNSAWRVIVLGMIFGLGCSSMCFFYQGILSLLAMRWEAGATPVGIGIGLAVAVYWVARNRNDLVCD